MLFKYQAKYINQLHSWFDQRVSKGNNGFTNFEAFEKWYNAQQPKVCHYCRISEEECQEIAVRGLLKSKRFPHNGIPGQGTSRAVWLEIDRVDPNEKYSPENCVLCCYYCNNDKSDVFHGNEYKDFFQNRAPFLRNLLNRNRINP